MFRIILILSFLLLFGCAKFLDECSALTPQGITFSPDSKYIAAFNSEKICVLDKGFKTIKLFKDPNITYLDINWEKSPNLVFFQKDISDKFNLISFDPKSNNTIRYDLEGHIFVNDPAPKLISVNESITILKYESRGINFSIDQKQLVFNPVTLNKIKTRETYFQRPNDISSELYYAESLADNEGTRNETSYFEIRKIESSQKKLRFELPIGQEQFAFSKNKIVFINESDKNASLQINSISENSTDIYFSEEKTVRIDYETYLIDGPYVDSLSISNDGRFLILSGTDYSFAGRCDGPIRSTCNVAYILVFDLEKNKTIYADESARFNRNSFYYSISSNNELIYLYNNQALGDAKIVRLE